MRSSTSTLSLRERLAAAPARLSIAAVDHALHAFARVRYALPDAHPSRFDLVVRRDLPYGPLPRQRLDAYLPTRSGRPLPVVLYAHGGGFAMLSKETHRLMAYALARSGRYVLFNIDYRYGSGHPYPAPLDDASLALRWVKENAARYGGDPSRIALAGESAGANLVTALAVASSWRRPEPFARALFDAGVSVRAVVASYGFLDLSHTSQYLAEPRIPSWAKALLLDAARSYVGPDLTDVAARFPLASPLRILEGGGPDRPLPPFFAAVGTRDPIFRCSKRLKAALDALGTPCELHVAPGEVHGYDALMWRPMAKKKWQATHAFLERALAAGPRRDDARELGEAV